MPTIPPGYVQINHVHSHPAADGEVVVTPAFAITGGFSETAATAAYNAWATEMMPLLASSLTFLGVTAYVGQDGGDPTIVEHFPVSPTSGGDTGIATPINTAYLVRKSTGLGGRRNRGRMYIPGVLADELGDDATITTTKFAALQLAVNDWLAAVVAIANVDEMVILHQGLTPGTPTPVVSLTLEEKVATQRGRLRD